MASLAGISNFYKLPDLRRRVFFTLGMLAVYRIGVFVTTPGVDRNQMKAFVAGQSGGLIGFFNLFSGGALENLSIFRSASCRISASIIAADGHGLRAHRRDAQRGEAGRRKIDQYALRHHRHLLFSHPASPECSKASRARRWRARPIRGCCFS
jgi:preprotein translocase subunit SecY